MKTCFIMVGVSGSGKSTAMKEMAQRMVGSVKVFSLDNCRMSFMDANHIGQWFSDSDTEADRYRKAFEYANENSAKFNSFVTAQWVEALRFDNVFVDNTNLTRKSRARWVNEARAKGFTIWAVNVMAPLNVVLARQSTRSDKSVPLNTVRDMYMRMQEVFVGEEADFITHIDGTGKATSRGMVYFAKQ